MLGTAIFRNLNDLETWLKQLSMEDGKVLYQSCLAESNGKKDVYGFLTYALKPDYWLDKESTLRYWQEQKQRLVDQARKMASYCASYGQQLYVREDVNRPEWVLGINPWSSARAASAFTH